MKWNITTLQANESKTFSYAVSLYSHFEARTTVQNTTLDKNAIANTNYNKNNISVKIEIDILNKYRKATFKGNFVSKFSVFNENNNPISNKIVIDKPFKVVDENVELIREVDNGIFDYEKQSFTIDISNTDAKEVMLFLTLI